MRKRMSIETGTRYGMLTIIKEVEPYYYRGHPFRQFLCQCDCGATSITTLNRLRQGKVLSCGCLKGTTHSKYKELTKTRIYNIWSSMKQRCYYPNAISYPNYGGRGIGICQEWKDSFKAFYDWAMEHGYNDDLTIDRIDYNGNYEPSNCKWSTVKEQAQNKRNNIVLELNGEKHTIAEWGRITGFKVGTLQNRKYAGWSDKKTLTYPLRKHKKYKTKNEQNLL